MSRNQGVLLVLLLCTVIGTAWFLHEQDTTHPSSLTSSTGPDAFITDMDIGVMGANGEIEYRIRAERMTHFPADDRYLLSHPDINIFRPDETRWHIVSERGQANGSVDRVWLLGQVDIRRYGTSTHTPLHIATHDLLVKPADELAETESSVTLSTDRQVIKAVGMKANFRDNTLELRSRVRGRLDGKG